MDDKKRKKREDGGAGELEKEGCSMAFWLPGSVELVNGGTHQRYDLPESSVRITYQSDVIGRVRESCAQGVIGAREYKGMRLGMWPRKYWDRGRASGLSLASFSTSW